MNDLIISKHLEESGGYSDLSKPVIITSGESLTPFYVNAEKLCRDENISQFLKEYGDGSFEVIDHAFKLYHELRSFYQDINQMAEKVDKLLPYCEGIAVSGGQRRDWIFSGPIARVLGISHVSIYKHEPDESAKVEVVYGDEVVDYTSKSKLPFSTVVHISDLLTKGSSCYSVDKDTGKEFGWIPTLRSKGVEIENLVTVVTRLQGGEGLLEGLEEPVKVHSFVAIDKEFLEKHSKQPEVAFAYVKSEGEWTKNYIIENGIGVLVPYFEPGGDKLTRAKIFLRNYEKFLNESGKMIELEQAVEDKYEKSLKEIVGGN